LDSKGLILSFDLDPEVTHVSIESRNDTHDYCFLSSMRKPLAASDRQPTAMPDATHTHRSEARQQATTAAAKEEGKNIMSSSNSTTKRRRIGAGSSSLQRRRHHNIIIYITDLPSGILGNVASFLFRRSCCYCAYE
jgi:hypothetical protein